jgi:proton-coupled amino acid transporter
MTPNESLPLLNHLYYEYHEPSNIDVGVTVVTNHHNPQNNYDCTTVDDEDASAVVELDRNDDDSHDNDDNDDDNHQHHHQSQQDPMTTTTTTTTTTYSQTIIHLIKGYIGCGILSLPWAVSQLGIPLGCGCILAMSLWTSYNCWTVVKLKRFIEKQTEPMTLLRTVTDDVGKADLLFLTTTTMAMTTGTTATTTNNTNSLDGNASSHRQSGVLSTTQSAHGSVASSTATNITYPDVGAWAYGVDFQYYVAICICTQQLAICTVFVSFVGENLYAVLAFLHPHNPIVANHQAVITAVIPVLLILSFLPSLKSLAPVMVVGTVFLMAGFASLGVIGTAEWETRPDWDDLVRTSVLVESHV